MAGPEKNYPSLNLEIFYPRPFAPADAKDYLQRAAVFLLRGLRHGFCNPVRHVHWHPVALPKSLSQRIALERLAPVSDVASAAPEQPVAGLCFHAAALALAVFWLETVPEKLDAALLVCGIMAMALPSLLIADGQYLAFLRLGLNGTWLGVFLAHLTPVFAYVFIVLKGPYRAFDPRYRAVALGLNADNYRFWSVVKLAMMKPTLAAAAAVGIGVSIAQYVPTQLIASGRLTTLPIEAVTLASGGSRPLMAVFALMLAVVPALAFIAAARIGRKPL